MALEADSVIFELKQVPYQPNQDKGYLYGFPQKGTPEATDRAGGAVAATFFEDQA